MTWYFWVGVVAGVGLLLGLIGMFVWAAGTTHYEMEMLYKERREFFEETLQESRALIEEGVVDVNKV